MNWYVSYPQHEFQPMYVLVLTMVYLSVTVDSPLPPGHYLDTEAMLKIKVEVAHPLVTPTQLASKQQLISTKEVSDSRG